ncbi:anaerobic ntp large subunit [Lasius niger]|uniref:Anaerobic ntp large subunit n=1 Tax=Lasius niger TaxID=67767 RepID=A0A0J7K1L0_LASNI|nr:anaerobic ntp large subunit [Lasius niger]
MPKEPCDWEHLPIRRIFGSAIKEKIMQPIENVAHENNIFTNAFSDKDVILSDPIKKNFIKEDSSAREFQKQALFKLNIILYKMERMENILYGFENKNKFTNEIEESDIQFPLVTVSDLNNFEEQLQESQFKNKVV